MRYLLSCNPTIFLQLSFPILKVTNSWFRHQYFLIHPHILTPQCFLLLHQTIIDRLTFFLVPLLLTFDPLGRLLINLGQLIPNFIISELILKLVERGKGSGKRQYLVLIINGCFGMDKFAIMMFGKLLLLVCLYTHFIYIFYLFHSHHSFSLGYLSSLNPNI